MIAAEECSKAQLEIERILRSEALRGSDGLRRLLRVLADKSFSGEIDALKEYSIGVDAFGKPASYDPRHDSTVRVHVGRLRQKLSEYYLTEGKEDPVIVELPKGKFKLQWQDRPEKPVDTPSAAARLEAEPSAPVRTRRSIKPLLISGCFAVVSVWAAWSTLQLREARQQSSVIRSQWTPEVAALWAPFVHTDRPLLISISAPMFVELPGFGIIRDWDVNRPSDIPKSATIAAFRKAVNSPPAVPLFYYSTLGDTEVSFRLGRFLASRKPNVSVVNGTELSWRQMSENNVILIGSPKFFNQQLASMPVKTELFLEPRFGIRNLKPRDHEPSAFIDTYEQAEVTGTAYALVTHTPGPQGIGEVLSISCRNGAGVWGATTWFTEPASARELVSKLRKSNGEVPRFYQVLLKIRFQDGVPIETAYVLHRELSPTGPR